MRKFLVISLLIVGCGAPNQSSKTDGAKSQQLSPEAKAKCEQTRAEVSKDPTSKLVFEPIPETPTLRFVTLNWAGEKIPVAVESVKDVLFSKGKTGLDVVVVYEDGSTLAAFTDDTPAPSVLFDAYTYTGDDVSCDDPTKVQTLVLKSIARPFNVERAHRIESGMLLVGTTEDGKHYVDWTMKNGNTVAYNGTRPGFASAVGKSGGGVVWVDTVNAILAKPNPAAIEDAKATFQKLGFSDQTLLSLDSILSE